MRIGQRKISYRDLGYDRRLSKGVIDLKIPIYNGEIAQGDLKGTYPRPEVVWENGLTDLSALFLPLTGGTLTGDVITSGNVKVGSDRPVDRVDDVIVTTTTVQDTASETTLWTGTIAANDLVAGNILKVIVNGVISNDSASDDITINVYIGSTLIESFNPAIGNVTGAFWRSDFVFTVRAIGASGSIAFRGITDIDGNEETVADIETVDTTVAEDITVKAQWDNAKVANSISIYQGFMEIKN